MVFDHFALNVQEPVKMADWYVENCNMKIVFSKPDAPFTRFLADKSGRVIVELYGNTAINIPDYANNHHLEFHFALSVLNAEEAKKQLLAVGASYIDEVKLDDGTIMMNLRDPFGIALQLCQRPKPLGA